MRNKSDKTIAIDPETRIIGICKDETPETEATESRVSGSANGAGSGDGTGLYILPQGVQLPSAPPNKFTLGDVHEQAFLRQTN